MTSTRWFGAALLGLASCVCACSAEPESVWLSLPDADGAATMLLGLRERDGVRVFVADAEEGARRTIIDEALSRTSAESIEVAFFDRSMSQAELTEGWLTAALPSQSRAHLVGNGAILGQPIERFVAQPFDSPPVWAPANSLSSELLGFQIEREEETCPSLNPTRYNRIEPFEATRMIELSEDHVLLIDEQRRHHVLDVRSGETQTRTAPYLFLAGDRGGGWTFLGDQTGQMWRGRGLDAFEQPAAVGEPLGRAIRAVAVGGEDDVFALTAGGLVHHFDGSSWTEIGTVQESRTTFVWIERGRAMLTADTPGVIYEVTTSAVRPVSVADSGILSVASIPEVGLLAGTSDGDVLRQGTGGWSAISDRYGWWVLDIVPFGGGAAFLLASGSVGSYHPQLGACGDIYASRFIFTGWLVSRDDGLLMISKVADVPETFIAWLEPL